MVRMRALFLMAIGMCFVVGCLNANRSDSLATGETPAPPAHQPAEPTPDVRETLYEDGGIATHTEGYVEADDEYILHGKMIHYWQNGQKKLEMSYLHGMPHGPKSSWYEDGQMWSSGNYVNGKQDGTWTVWYRNGRKAQEDHFDDGAWHGLFTKWHPNGQMLSQVEFVDGKMQGTYTQWDEFGNVIKQEEYVDSQVQP